MKPNGIITLTTDFGENDGYVGTMKGVIFSINPHAQIVDISHQIPAQKIDIAAFILFNSYKYFPPGTIHVIVVDPGVGSQRKILAVQAGGHIFIAPDNQLLKYIFFEHETTEVIEVLNKKYFLDIISATFHGRDIFAPVAAHLSLGTPIKNLGKITTDFRPGEINTPQISKDKIEGEIIFSDHFGNCISNISQQAINGKSFTLECGTTFIDQLSNFYADAKPGGALALIGSSGYLEIAVRDGNAQKEFDIKIHDPVILNIKLQP